MDESLTLEGHREPTKTRLRQLGLAIGAIWGGAYVIAAVGAPLEYSRQYLPEPLHLGVVGLYSVGVGYLMTWTMTAQSRRRNLARIIEWFGPYGLVLLPLLIMFTSAWVLASFLTTLSAHGWVELAPGGAAAVSEDALRDFFLWHLVNLVPIIDIPETLKWREPVLYTQARVGWLVLFYQALVVIPGISAIRWYWTTRHSLPNNSSDMSDPDM